MHIKQDVPKQRKKILPTRLGEKCQKTNQLPDTQKTKLFCCKIWKRGDHNRKAKWIKNMEKKLRRLEEGPKTKIQRDSLRAASKKREIGKRQAMMSYMDTFKNSLPSSTDWLLKLIYAEKKQKYLNGGPKERPQWSKKFPKRNHPKLYRHITCLPMMRKIPTAKLGRRLTLR